MRSYSATGAAAIVACLAVLLAACSSSAQTIYKPRILYSASSLPPSYPTRGYFGGDTDYLLPRAMPSVYVARVVGLIYFGFNTTHGTICTGTTIDANWILTSSHCVNQIRMRGKAAAKVYLLNEEDEKYDSYDVSTAYRHAAYGGNTSSNDIGLIGLSSPYANLPEDRPRLHATMDNANRRESQRAHVRFATPIGASPFLGQSQQIQDGRFCLPPGVSGGPFLCARPVSTAVYSGAGRGDGGAPLFGPYQRNAERIAIIGIYSGSSNNQVNDPKRINYYCVVARFDDDVGRAQRGNFARWVKVA